MPGDPFLILLVWSHPRPQGPRAVRCCASPPPTPEPLTPGQWAAGLVLKSQKSTISNGVAHSVPFPPNSMLHFTLYCTLHNLSYILRSSFEFAHAIQIFALTIQL